MLSRDCRSRFSRSRLSCTEECRILGFLQDVASANRLFLATFQIRRRMKFTIVRLDLFFLKEVFVAYDESHDFGIFCFVF